MTKELKLMSWPVRLSSNYFTGFLMINHPPVEGACEYGWGHPVEYKDEKLLNELCDYFEERTSSESLDSGSMEWDGVVSTQTEVIDLLKDRNIEELHRYLSVMFTKSICNGTAQGPMFFQILKENRDDIQSNTGFAIYDKFLTLMESNGIIPTFSPEQYLKKNEFLKFYTIDPDDYLTMLEKKFDCDLTAPRYQGLHFGLQTKKHGLYSDRDLMALAVAIKIKETYWNRPDITIADLGGGVGYLGYWLTKLGFKNITYIDLPTTTISAMYFLRTNDVDTVKFITPADFDGNYDVVINLDGLTQFSKEIAEDYIKKIEDGGARHFVSINREFDEFRVLDICDMRKISRTPFALRKGYVEEDYIPETT